MPRRRGYGLGGTPTRAVPNFGGVFGPSAIAFYKGIEAQRGIQRNIGKAIPALGPHGAFAPKPGTINPTADERTRAQMLLVAQKLQQQARTKQQGGNPRTGEGARSPVRPEPQRGRGRAPTGSPENVNFAETGERTGNPKPRPHSATGGTAGTAMWGGGTPPVQQPPAFGAKPAPGGKSVMAPPRPGQPTPEQIFTYTAAANRNAMQNNPNLQGPDVFGAVVQDEGVSPAEAQLVWQGMMRESNGRNVLQQVKDVNSGGNEAFGPLQIIPGTFNAYADPGWNRQNAYQSMRAAIRYARAKYGANWARVMAYGQNPARGITGY